MKKEEQADDSAVNSTESGEIVEIEDAKASADNVDIKDTASPAGSNKDGEEKKPALVERGEVGELAKTALLAIVIALLIRTFLYEPFNIPSSSMKPTLLIGDYLFVYKPAYGYSRYSFPFGLAPIEGRIWGKEPRRGDVVVFVPPSNKSISFIKRLVGLPGDRIQVKRGRLYINDKLVPREFVRVVSEKNIYGQEEKLHEYIETLPGGVIHRIYEVSDDQRLDNTDVFVVPEGHYFMMGDNRDNSQDSRVKEVVGFVPFENFVGRADFLFYSTNHYAGMFEFWKWPWTVRYSRLFMDIDPIRSNDSDAVAGDGDSNNLSGKPEDKQKSER